MLNKILRGKNRYEVVSSVKLIVMWGLNSEGDNIKTMQYILSNKINDNLCTKTYKLCNMPIF